MPEPRTDRDDWQPMSTAPKDHEILGWDGCSIGVMWWQEHMALLTPGGRPTWAPGWNSLHRLDEPTNWMPLPTPPLERTDE